MRAREMRNMRNRDHEKRTWVAGRVWRAALWLTAVAITLLPPHIAAQISTTTIQGTVYRADGGPAGGTLLLSWPAFTTPQNQAVAAGSSSAAIGADGFVSVNLTPNADALPSGTYYTAVYHLNDGTVNQEYWVVPASANASIASVRAQLQPSTVAVQPVSKAYLDSAIASLNGSWLPLAGGTLTGALNLNGDPAAANQAATKHYADQLAAAQLPLSGGTVTGPLNAKQLEGHLYADQWQSGTGTNDGIAMSVSECASLPYACQVLAPALYAKTEAPPWGGVWGWAATNTGTWVQGPPGSAPAGCITDYRFGGPEVICVPGPQPAGFAQGNNQRAATSFVADNISASPYIWYTTAPGLFVGENTFNGGWNFTNNQSNEVGLELRQTQFAPSSMNALQIVTHGLSNGDHIGILEFDLDQGGTTAGDNEGNEDKYMHLENGEVYQGTIKSLTTISSGTSPCTAPCKVFNATLTSGMQGILADGLALIDLSRTDSTGYITNMVNNGNQVETSGADWDQNFGDSNGHTTTTAAVSQGPATNLFPMTNVTVAVANAGGFTTSSPACIFDQTGLFWECQSLSAVSTAANTLTFAVLDEPFLSGSIVAQGGMTGMGFEMVADEVTSNNNYNGMGVGEYGPGTLPLRTVWPVMYNVSGNSAYIMGGSREAFGAGNTRGYAQMGSGGTVTATVGGGSVTACSASGGSGYNTYVDGSGYMVLPPQLSYTVNSGATPPVLALTNGGSGGSLSGCTVVSGGSGVTSISVTVTPTNGYAIYPMARTVNVWNPTTGAVDGSSIATDQTMGNFQTGDTIEQEHYYVNSYTGARTHVFGYQGGTGQEAIFDGAIGGTTGYFGYAGSVWNQNSLALYNSYPNTQATPWVVGRGRMQTPQGYLLKGPFGNGLAMSTPPFGRGGMSAGLSVGCIDANTGTNVCTTWTRSYAMLSAANQQDNGWAEDGLFYNPTTYSWLLTAGANAPVGMNSYCYETLTGSASGGLSITCNGKTSKLDVSGNLSLPGTVRAQGGVTGATINGELTVDGTTYTTLNAAWNAAVSQANATGQNQTIRLGPGTFAVTATLTEPINGACVSLIGSAAPTVTANNANASTVVTVTSSLGGDLFSLQNTAGSQAQSCTFRNLMILANKKANHGFNLQWFRGLYVDDVTVNDTTQDAFYLGESSGTHQANFEMRNVTVSYSASTFTPASRPNFGLNLQSTVLDSFVQNLLVRNALQAAVYNAGGGTTFELIHGFGYPYTCTSAPCNNTETNTGAADASWATNYEVVDTGSGGNMYFNTYMDSPAIAAFDLRSNGVQVNGGHIQWPETTSFPNATFAEVEATVSSNLVISNVDCLNMRTRRAFRDLRRGTQASGSATWAPMGVRHRTPRLVIWQAADSMCSSESPRGKRPSMRRGITPPIRTMGVVRQGLLRRSSSLRLAARRMRAALKWRTSPEARGTRSTAESAVRRRTSR